MKYYIIRYTDNLPDGFGGTTKGPLIRILPKYKYDTGLLEHEKNHVRQWYAMTALGVGITAALMLLVSPALWPAGAVAALHHPLLYKYLRPYRQWCEVQAYRKQIEVGGYTDSDFAVSALVDKYSLCLDTSEATAFLSD